MKKFILPENRDGWPPCYLCGRANSVRLAPIKEGSNVLKYACTNCRPVPKLVDEAMKQMDKNEQDAFLDWLDMKHA